MKKILKQVQDVKSILIKKQMYEPAAMLRDVERDIEKGESSTPNLTKEELERLAVFSEELGEVQQIVGKILRHGYDSSNPSEENGKTNREKLEIEIGDLICGLGLMVQEHDVQQSKMEEQTFKKVEKLNKWLHYNKVNI